MAPKRLSQRERALTVYFATAAQKTEFVKRAEDLGLTASFVGLLCLTRGIETGVLNELEQVISQDMVAAGVKSTSPKRPPRSAKKKS